MDITQTEDAQKQNDLRFEQVVMRIRLRHYQALAKMADAQRDARNAEQAKAAAHYGAMVQELRK